MFNLKKLTKVVLPITLAMTMSSQALALDKESCETLAILSMSAMSKYQDSASLKETKKSLDENFTDPAYKEITAGILSFIGNYPIAKTEEAKKETVTQVGKDFYATCIGE